MTVELITLGQVATGATARIPMGKGKHRGNPADDGLFKPVSYVRHIDGHHVFLADTFEGHRFLFADSLGEKVLTHG